ncbi:MAG: hypothetical protein RLZZ494_1662 [Pseudomonadota bacterium]|jgi:hypothetical protein
MTALRFLLRVLTSLLLVLGVSVAFAWAWDRSEQPPVSAPEPALASGTAQR